ncbi:MAG: hypothetical protein CMD75_01010 [Gammaproteobacteria bacterium]|nr:hypothetical protein [Gammaproteobacteria bacterium]
MEKELSAAKNDILFLCNSYEDEHDGDILLWSEFMPPNQQERVFSIPQIVEEHADALKKSYLEFIYNLSTKETGSGTVLELLAIDPGFSFWWLTQLSEKCDDHKSSYNSEIVKTLALKLWLEDKDYSSVVMCGFGRNNVAVIKPFLLNLGLECKEESQNTDFWERFRNRLDLLPWKIFFSAPIIFLFDIIKRMPLSGVGVQEWQNSSAQNVCVSYSDNLDQDRLDDGAYLSRYWENLPELMIKNDGHLAILHMFIPSKAIPDAGSAAKVIGKFNKYSDKIDHVTLNSFLTWQLVLGVFINWLKIVLVGFRLKKRFAKICGPLWPFLRRNYLNSFFGIFGLNNLLLLRLFEAAFKVAPKKERGLYLQENQAWESGFIYAWRKYDHQRLLGVMHVPIQFWNLRMFFDKRSVQNEFGLPQPDASVVICEESHEFLQPYASHEILIGEAVRYNYLLNAKQNKKKVRDIKNKRKTLLLLGDHIFRNTDKMLSLLSECYNEIKEKYTVIIKFHPNLIMDSVHLRDLDHEISDRAINELLQRSDVAFTSNTSASAIDAHCYGLTVVSLRDPRLLNKSVLSNSKGISFVNTANELRDALISSPSISDNVISRDYLLLDKNLSAWKNILGYEKNI